MGFRLPLPPVTLWSQRRHGGISAAREGKQPVCDSSLSGEGEKGLCQPSPRGELLRCHSHPADVSPPEWRRAEEVSQQSLGCWVLNEPGADVILCHARGRRL
ncbi:hypothetical protein COCON_G00079830 [Conger conger]|uniref:Uncharacterized protein n=1 Tax=Conger conger TaxID=82655 RepID=A0A9Q1I1U5_CONCO|nr:hypothetical protein COCON_G00079830 [Conger conger]